MDRLDEMLLEVKDTSELMIDLAYSSLLYNNRDIAEEVFSMEEAVDEMVSQIQNEAIDRVIEDKNAPKALAIIRLSTALEEISDAAMQIADVVLRDVQPHPVIQLSLRDSEVIITAAQVQDDSSLANRTLSDVKLATQSGMWVIAVKRDRRYIYGPDEHTVIAAGDVLFARGPKDGEAYFRDLASGAVKV
jgi:uncharacterized protein with PhoU and TrkA domain